MPHDRTDRRAEEALNRPDNRVALFLDYENIRHSLEHHFDPAPSPQTVAEKLWEMAGKFGHVLLANVYADWSIHGTEPREFRRRQIEPRLVLTKENGDDRTDITMSLDALTTLYDDPEMDVYVIASGDSDFHDLLQRLRRRGKRIVVCGLRSDTGRELIRGSDKFIPLEELMGLRPGRQARPVTWDEYDWTGFIRLIRDLDRKLNFVGLRYVATKVLNPHNCGLSDRGQKQELLNRAIDTEIITPYQVENIEEGGEPVSACRLNEEHPLVKDVLACLECEEAEAPAEAAPDAEPAPAEEAPAEEKAPAEPRPAVRRRSSLVDGDDVGRPGETAR
ncbi:MAG: NYN domain-containing protein [Planctomycetota bacterium]